MKKKRRSNINDFRFYPVYQRHISEQQDSGPIDDYKNHIVYPCNWRLMSAMEIAMQESRRIKANIRVMGRYPDFSVADGDRFFFPGSGEVLRVQASEDPTGRKEYMRFLCLKGAYTTKTAIQHGSKKVIMKVREDSDSDFLTNIQAALTTPLSGYENVLSDELDQLVEYANFDLLCPKEDIPFISETGKLYIVGKDIVDEDLTNYANRSEITIPNSDLTAYYLKDIA